MIKLSTLYPVMIVLLLTSLAGTINAQQTNKPVSTPAVNPVVAPLPVATTGNINYVRTWDAAAPITDPGLLINAGYRDVKQATQYVDGLGRPVQTVSSQITPKAKDLVAPVEYDAFGREVYKYQPYVSTESNGALKMDPFGKQAAFYQGWFSNQGTVEEQVYYGQTAYEPSPLNRVIKTMAPGNNWAGSGKGVSMDYQVNTANDALVWTIPGNALTYDNSNNLINTNIPSSAGTYSAGQLYKNVTKDEAGNAVVEYKDKEGLIVLKKVQVGNIASDYSGHSGFLCTYYVYDEWNQLRFVIPPKAVAQLINNNWQFNNDMINELCFRYEYDDRRRMIAKKLPGAGWVYMVYDTRDRLVFTQDANMRNNNQWMATLYDGINRPVMTGIIIYNSKPDALQWVVTSQTTASTVPSPNPPPGISSDLLLATPGHLYTGLYQAYNSITLGDGFESGNDFTAEIVGGFGLNADPQESALEGMTISKNPLPPGAIFTPLTKTYYDNYKFTKKTYSTAYNGYLDAGTDAGKGYNLHPLDVPMAAFDQTTGMVTGIQVRVMTDPANLASASWLTTVNFYDNRNRVIQINQETIKGTDIVTNRYDFTGKVITSYVDHINSSATPNGVHVLTNYKYDHAGRLMEIWKTLNDDNNKILIAKNEYDELGQLLRKELGHKKDNEDNYTNEPLERLNYTYNIRGWLTGINKDYANNTGTPEAWFGMELNYDKGFSVPQYNGNIAGTKWRSKGDGQQRAYGYTYDKANRLMGADFTQFDGGGYINDPVVNFDMLMGVDGLDVSKAYDENGNIQAMKQWGLKLNNSPVIDDLHYSYFNGGNKLSSVSDLPPAGAGVGDFTDNNNGDDYGYDENGNMLTDLNKRLIGVTGTDKSSGAISYNHLNLPWKIIVKKDDKTTDKGDIRYIYDAAGNKLQKIVTEYNASVTDNNSNYTCNITTTTSYVGAFVYESKEYSDLSLSSLGYTDKLQFAGHEEGRIRYIAVNGNIPAHFEYDYFVKDHLGNVRMVLTEQKDQHNYIATMETSARTQENQLFDNLEASQYPARTAGFPGGGAEDPNETVAYVNGNIQKKGPGIVLKVMAGDVVDIGVRSLYHENPGTKPTVDLFNDILASLAGGIVSYSGVAKGTLADLSDPVNSPLKGALTGFRQDNDNDLLNKPKAYLNWMLVDEQFNYVSTFPQSGAMPVGAAEAVAVLRQCGIEITKNGYLYIYVSNETENWDVFFDDLAVTHHTGPLLEETHYYPFGLTMAGISSKALGKLQNRYKFNEGTELENKEFTDGSGLDLYATEYRSYDPQIGRFWQIDELAELDERWSPYVFANNNPILLNDALGLASDTTILPTVTVTPSGAGALGTICYTCKLAPDPAKAVPSSSGSGTTPSQPDTYPEDLVGFAKAINRDPKDLYDWYLTDKLRKTVVEKHSFFERLFTDSPGKNIFGEDVASPYLTGTVDYGTPFNEGSGAFTIFKNVSKRIRAKSTINFFVGMKLVDFEANMAKVAGKAWQLTKDGRAKTLVHNGLEYVSRTFSKSGGSTVEVVRDGKIIQKFRLMD